MWLYVVLVFFSVIRFFKVDRWGKEKRLFWVRDVNYDGCVFYVKVNEDNIVRIVLVLMSGMYSFDPKGIENVGRLDIII